VNTQDRKQRRKAEENETMEWKEYQMKISRLEGTERTKTAYLK